MKLDEMSLDESLGLSGEQADVEEEFKMTRRKQRRLMLSG